MCRVMFLSTLADAMDNQRAGIHRAGIHRAGIALALFQKLVLLFSAEMAKVRERICIVRENAQDTP